jgi:hypothetical protein
VALDSEGNLFVAELDNHRIQRFTRGVPGWEQVNINGFGSRWMENIPSLAVFHDALYAGTSNYSADIHHVFSTTDGTTWQEGTQDLGGGISTLKTFNNLLIAGTWEGLLWSSPDGAAWTNVFTTTHGFASFSVYNNIMFAGTYTNSSEEGANIYKSTNGTDWTPFVINGNGDPTAAGVLSGATFKGNHYFGVADWSGTGGARIWRTDGTTVTEVMEGGFEDPGNLAPGGMAAFNDWLYVSVANQVSTQVWRSNSGNADSWTWAFEFFQGTNGVKDRTGLIVYNNQLYLTAQNDWTGMSVWRTEDGLDWQRIGFGGFGDSNSVWTEWGSSLAVFDNRLYIGVNNYASGFKVWRYDPEISWLPLISK